MLAKKETSLKNLYISGGSVVVLHSLRVEFKFQLLGRIPFL